MWAFFSVAIAGVAAAIGLLLRLYPAPSVSAVVKAATAYAWLVAFAVVALVPVDVASTLDGSGGGAAVDAMWKASFWSTQALTWLALPFFQVYADAGDFTVGARCWTSVKENGILYGAAAAAGVAGVACIVAVERALPSPSDLLALGLALSNTFALSAGLLLMGYGLVELPRGLWRSSRPEQLLKWCAHRAGRHAAEVLRATRELEAVVRVVCANQRQMARRDPLRPYMEEIAARAEAESPVKPSQLAASALDVEGLDAEDLEYNYDLEGLAALRRRLAAAVHDYQGARSQYEEAVAAAATLREVVKSRERGLYEAPPGAPGAGAAWGNALWRYRCVAHPHACRAAALALGALSAAVVWSEATIFTARRPDLSPFSLALRGALPRGGPAAVELLTALPLAYVCACTYFALFRVTAFDYNKLLPRATTGAALMQNGSLVCRFAPATCWNFLHMVHMDGASAGAGGRPTVFTRNMGAMAVLPALGKHLNVWLPLLLGVHCGAIWLGLWDRALEACGGGRYRFTK